MARPGVFALNLVKSFPGLLDNKVFGVAFYHSFDPGLFVARYDDEARDMRRDAVVFSRRKFDRFNALARRALAMERKYLLDTMLFCAFLDPLVDRMKDFLVMGGRPCEVHRHIVPRFRSRC